MSVKLSAVTSLLMSPPSIYGNDTSKNTLFSFMGYSEAFILDTLLKCPLTSVTLRDPLGSSPGMSPIFLLRLQVGMAMEEGERREQIERQVADGSHDVEGAHRFPIVPLSNLPFGKNLIFFLR